MEVPLKTHSFIDNVVDTIFGEKKYDIDNVKDKKLDMRVHLYDDFMNSSINGRLTKSEIYNKSIELENDTFNIYVSRIEFKEQTDYISDITGNIYNDFANLKLMYNELKDSHNKVIDICTELSNRVYTLNKRMKELEEIDTLQKVQKLVYKLRILENRIKELEQIDYIVKDLTFDMPPE